MMNPLKALLIGRDHGLIWFLPPMLKRAGFIVDVIASSPLMKSCRFIQSCDVIPANESIIPKVLERIQQPYDWIIITEDGVLAEILHSNLPTETKLKILPVLSEDKFSHIHSKIGLSQIFSENGIQTPPYKIANNLGEALEGANQLGYPILLKVDASGGGAGVCECKKPQDLQAINERFFEKPVLIQKKIEGVDLDLSALFLDGDLVHFSYSKMEKFISNKFGPSSLRTYRPLCYVDEPIFNELTQIGKTLGAHGFTNITCIESANNTGRYYVETDMRANVWADIPKYFDEDPSERILNWFSKKEKLQFPISCKRKLPKDIQIPCFMRLKLYELLINRYKVWKFIPKEDRKLIIGMLMHELTPTISIHDLKYVIKWFIPKRYHRPLKALYTKLKSIINTRKYYLKNNVGDCD